MAAEDRQDVAKMVRKTLERMERATSILMSQDLAQAEAFIAEKEQMSNSCREAQRLHLERQAAAASGASSSDYIDQLNCLRRINSHITSVAYALARPRSAALEASRTAPPPA
jgi:phosphate:Na+ symporter